MIRIQTYICTYHIISFRMFVLQRIIALENMHMHSLKINAIVAQLHVSFSRQLKSYLFRNIRI